MRRTTTLAISAVLLPATLALSACSGSSTPAAKAAGTPSSAATTTSADSTPTATASTQPTTPLLTGSQLKGFLAPASDFPSGFAPVAAETQDTGTGYEQQSINPPPTPQCALFDTNGIITITGYSPVSFAQGDYQSTTVPGEYAQEIDVFQGTASQSLMTALAAAAFVCPTYPDSETNTTAHVKQATTTVDGDPALVFTTTDSAWKGGLTIEAVRVGTAVVTVMASTQTNDNGGPEAARLAGTIVANLAGKS